MVKGKESEDRFFDKKWDKGLSVKVLVSKKYGETFIKYYVVEVFYHPASKIIEFSGFIELGREIMVCELEGGEMFMRTPMFEPHGFCRNPKSDIYCVYK